MTMSKLILSLGLVAVLSACQRADQPAPVSSPPKVTIATPVQQLVEEWDEYTGRLGSPNSVEIRARVSGYLEKVHFAEGTEVKEGELLFTIDPRPYQTEVDRMEAEAARARTRAELAESEAKRAEPLFRSRALSTDDYEERVKAATEAAQAVRSAEAQLATAKLNLEFTQIRAPIAGRISDARVTAGNLVDDGADATLLTTLVSLDPIYCYLEVDERSALRYRDLRRQGQRVSALDQKIPAQMALANESEFTRRGEVDFVDNEVNSSTGTIRARAVFPNPDRVAAPGFFARVRIPARAAYEGLLVRESALASDQGQPMLWVLDEKNLAQPRPVVLGPVIDGLRAIRSGLKAEDRVIITGLMAVRPGQPVNSTEAAMKLPAAP